MLALCSWVVELFGSFVSLDGKEEGSVVGVGVKRERERERDKIIYPVLHKTSLHCTYLSQCYKVLCLEWGRWSQRLESPVMGSVNRNGRLSRARGVRCPQSEYLCRCGLRESLVSINAVRGLQYMTNREGEMGN